jgi:hypothetical protein
VQAWFHGANPHLEDRSPARVLREKNPQAVGPQLLSAVRAFARRMRIRQLRQRLWRVGYQPTPWEWADCRRVGAGDDSLTVGLW